MVDLENVVFIDNCNGGAMLYTKEGKALLEVPEGLNDNDFINLPLPQKGLIIITISAAKRLGIFKRKWC